MTHNPTPPPSLGQNKVLAWRLTQAGEIPPWAWGGKGVTKVPSGIERCNANGGRSHHQFIMEFLLRVMKKT